MGCPAYAGMDPRYRGNASHRNRLPRLRGDGPLIGNSNQFTRKVAPPTRGWTLWSSDDDETFRGCPAYAGMDRATIRLPAEHYRLPRLRGDGPFARLAGSGFLAVAPPTRGWTLAWRLVESGGAGCPAYAGMDPWIGSGGLLPSWLPRLRGDGPEDTPFTKALLEVAPPTRGWTRRAGRGSAAS